ncbi:caspase family protein [Crocosphaera sp.]|uniref:nSTAND1 domain-containing NTPase n=1 Tax=Crocosphaera sp. TaxID=2729996 RepID=UPI00260273FC|nr:caspase family protein [Crocosphaera sp.]MDJ0581918.1 caspase family protein [Crocosphaera sp.]
MRQQWEALIVGIDEYPIYTTLNNLTVARKDAEDIAKKLEKYGYEKFRIQRLVEQPSQKGSEPNVSRLGIKSEDLKEKIKNLFNPPSQQETPDLALFYFSGHGWRKIIDNKEDTFLATSDVFPNAEIYGIPLSWLGEQIEKSPVKKIIIWLDCCFSGELIKYLPKNKDYCLITGTRSSEIGLEIRDKQGLFTQTLLKGLNPEEYADGIVDSHKLKEFIEKEMAQTSQRPLIANSSGSILLTTRYTPDIFKDECPYRSLSYFAENREDADVFYGRSKITNDLINRVQKDRFIVVLGASGSGKSSLLRAGLLYQLKLGQVIKGSNLWTYITPFSPTENPLQQLENVGWVEETKPNIMRSEVGSQKFLTTFRRYRTEVGINEQAKIIMIIDQFEECFTMCDESTRETFFKQLIELFNNYSNLRMIMGMRSDFRGRLREYKNLVDCLNKPYINIEHLNREEIEEVIVQPAKKSGLLIESSLKQQLINDVEDYPGSLPLLEDTLTQLWQETRNKGERFLTLKTYQNLGGIEGTIEKRASNVFDNLDEKEREVAQRIFLELTQVGDTYDVRRRVCLNDLVNQYHTFKQLNTVSQKLASDKNRLIVRDIQTQSISYKFVLVFLCRVNLFLFASLLTKKRRKKLVDLVEIINEQPSKIQIDVVHEALIRHWQQLRQWKYQYRAAIVTERKIEEEGQEWQNKGRKTSDLLQGSKLGEAEEYLKNYGHLGMLDGVAEDCINASFRQNKIRRWQFIGLVSFVALMAIVATFFAIESNKRAKLATLKEQAATVKSLFPIEPLEPLVLAIATTGENRNDWQVPEILLEVQSSLYEAINQVREHNSFEGHKESVTMVAITPEGNIVSGSQDQTVKVWSPQGKLLHTLEGHQGQVWTVAMTPEGNIVSGSQDQTVKVWSPQGKLLHTLEGHQEDILTVAITPEGNIVSGSQDQTVKVWSPQGKLLHTLEGHQGWVRIVAITPEGNIVSGSHDKTVKVWSPDGKLLHTLEGHQNTVWTVTLTKEGNIVSGSQDQTVKVWSPDGKLLHTLEGHQNWVRTVAITPEGNIVSGSDDNTVKVWSPQGKLLYPLEGHQGSVSNVTITPQGNIVSGSDDNTVKVWSPQGKLLHTLKGHQKPILTLTVTKEGNIVSGSEDNTVKVLNPQGNLLHNLEGHQEEVTMVAITPEGNIVSGSDDNTVKVWSPQGSLLHTLEGHQDDILTLTVTKEGNIVSGSKDNTVKVWSPDGKLLHTLEGHQNWVWTVTLTKEGNIISGSYDNTVKVWSPDGKLLYTLEGHQNWVRTVAITPEGNIVSGSYDNTVKVWSPDGKLLYTLEGHQGLVSNVIITPDGNIVSGSLDKTVKVWSPQGKLLHTLEGHQNTVWTVDITPEGNIVSGSLDKTVKIWRGGDWSDWLEVGCERLQFHPVLLSVASVDMEDEAKSEAETAEKAAETCLKYGGWNNEEKAEFLVRKGFAIAEETGDIKAANRKLKSAKKLDKELDIKSLQEEVKQLAESSKNNDNNEDDL